MYWHLCIGNMQYDLMMIHIRCRTLSCQASQVASALDTPLFSLQLPRNNCFLHTTGKFFHLCLINSIITTCYTCSYCVTICCLLLHCLTSCASIIQLLLLFLSAFIVVSPAELHRPTRGLTPGTSIHQQRTPQRWRELHPKRKRCSCRNPREGHSALRHYKPAARNKTTLLAMSRSRCGTEPT